MAQFDDLQVSGQIRCANLIVGSTISQGLAVQVAETAVALAAGTNSNVALPGYNGVGNACFLLNGASGANLGGIYTDEGAGSLSVVDGQTVTLVNVGANPIGILANSGASAVGNRFAAACTIGVGCALDVVRVGNLYYPKFPIASS